LATPSARAPAVPTQAPPAIALAPAWRAQLSLLRQMTLTRIQCLDQTTPMGFLWTLLFPLVNTAVLYAAFAHTFAAHVPHFAFFTAAGLVHWHFFSKATTACVDSFQSWREICRSYPFNKILVPISAVLAHAFPYLLECAILVIVVPAVTSANELRPLYLLAGVALNLLLALGCGIVLSLCSLSIRDTAYIWGLASRILFFTTPIFYAPATLPARVRSAFALNPVGGAIDLFRHGILATDRPAFSQGVAVGLVALVSLLGWLLCARWHERVQEQL
jgi:ABC-type polysaccharide/polyol phosphate export permease